MLGAILGDLIGAPYEFDRGNKTKQVLQLHEISQKEFLDNIEEDDFFQLFGNPVIINCDNGQKLVCMAWPMAEKLMRMTGRGAEADEVIRKAAEKECFDGEE